MSNYLPVYKNIWTSNKFNKLNAQEKLIFLYLITSPTSHNTGIFNILLKRIACDCDLDIDVVESAIKKMEEIELLKYWENENLIYIYKMFKFTRGTIKRPKTLYKTILRHEQLIENHEIWQTFKEENLSFYEDLKAFEQEQENEEAEEINDS